MINKNKAAFDKKFVYLEGVSVAKQKRRIVSEQVWMEACEHKEEEFKKVRLDYIASVARKNNEIINLKKELTMMEESND